MVEHSGKFADGAIQYNLATAFDYSWTSNQSNTTLKQPTSFVIRRVVHVSLARRLFLCDAFLRCRSW
ncbi:hypothetical protein PAXINDRAFT_134966 [Paxillus involutus ATCC 200175]|uniref:Uncharacterized protein n=1 Tax=Paxillus involutus ATCC 200175 TaxID=664439 RepID=A0A0C9TFI7_PAXIN|nr:hypothetical protein PAXINDRAFT_134966 [Paxillus involutus ATCC 200175]